MFDNTVFAENEDENSLTDYYKELYKSDDNAENETEYVEAENVVKRDESLSVGGSVVSVCNTCKKITCYQIDKKCIHCHNKLTDREKSEKQEIIEKLAEKLGKKI